MNHTTFKSLTDQSANDKVKNKTAFSKFKKIFKIAKGDGFEDHELQALSNSFHKIERRFDDDTPPNKSQQNQLAKAERMLNRAIISNVVTEHSNSSKREIREILDAIKTIESTNLEPVLNRISEIRVDNSEQGVNTINRIDTLAKNLTSNQNELFTLLDQKIKTSNQADIIPAIETHGLNASNNFNDLSSKLDTIIGLVNTTPNNDPYAADYARLENIYFEANMDRHAHNKAFNQAEVDEYYTSYIPFMNSLDLSGREVSIAEKYSFRAEAMYGAMTNTEDSLATEPSLAVQNIFA